MTVKKILGSCLLFALANTLSAEEVSFGGPDAVPNQLKKDRDGWVDFQKDLAKRGVELSFDYSAIGFVADDAANGDDYSAGGMLRFYGQWQAFSDSEGNNGSLIWKLEHRHDYTETAPKDFLFGAGALGLETPPFSDQKERLTNLYWKQLN